MSPARLPLSRPDLTLEQARSGRVCGIDEAGRGPLAGPVVAAAVILDPQAIPEGIADSKALTRAARTRLFSALADAALIGIGMASVEEIDRLNILQASLLAMARAVAALPSPPDCALVDGRHAPDLPCQAQTVIGGDARVLSIAAASVIAKVTRDRLMARLAFEHPGYGWERNMGYGTAEHLRGLTLRGATPHHRRSFAPVRACLDSVQAPDSQGG